MRGLFTYIHLVLMSYFKSTVWTVRSGKSTSYFRHIVPLVFYYESKWNAARTAPPQSFRAHWNIPFLQHPLFGYPVLNFFKLCIKGDWSCDNRLKGGHFNLTIMKIQLTLFSYIITCNLALTKEKTSEGQRAANVPTVMSAKIIVTQLLNQENILNVRSETTV